METKLLKTKVLFAVMMLLFGSLTISYAAFPVQASDVAIAMNETQVAANEASTSKGKSQLIALLLSIFVGLIGVHRFYLGYIWQGIVQILTIGGLGIWALIDIIRIVIGDLKPNGAEYSDKL